MRVRLVNLASDDCRPTTLPDVGMVRLSLPIGKATIYEDLDGISLHLWEPFVIQGDAVDHFFAFKRAVVVPAGREESDDEG